MNELDRWIYLGGPEPVALRPLFEALREPVAAPPADAARMSRGLFARIASMRASVATPSATVVPEPVTPAPPAEAPARWAALRPEATITASDEKEAQPAIETAQPSIQTAPPAIEEAPIPSVKRGPARLASTAPALDLPLEEWRARGELPFIEPPPPPDPADKSRYKTEKVPVMPTPTGTVGVDDNSISCAVALVPFPGNTLGSGQVLVPPLTVVQYASLCVELLFEPAREADVLIRYQVVSKPAHRALDEHWRERFASKPEELAEFEAARAVYAQWLQMARR